MSWKENVYKSKFLARVDFAAVFVPKLDCVIVHGGYNDEEEFCDFTELNLETMTL